MVVPSDGSAPQPVMSQYGTSMFFTLDRLNSDNLSHAHLRTSGDDKTGLVQIGFEDLLNGGDKDFDDSRFSIDVGWRMSGASPPPRFGRWSRPMMCCAARWRRQGLWRFRQGPALRRERERSS